MARRKKLSLADRMAAVDQAEREINEGLALLKRDGQSDPRGLAVAATHFETAFMYMRKSLFPRKP